MDESINGLKAYVREIFRHPVKCGIGILTGLLLLILSINMLDLSFKRLIICICLSFGTGFCIMLPEWDRKISMLLLALSICYFPIKIFQRIELPFHDMSRLLDGVAFLSVWFIICIYLIVYLLTQRTWLALGIGNLIIIFLFLGEYFVFIFRGTIVSPTDLLAVRDALAVASHYRFVLSPEAFYTVLYLIFFTAAGFRARVELKWKSLKIISLVLAFAVCLGFYGVIFHTTYTEDREITGHYWMMSENQPLNGTFISFFVIYKEGKMVVPPTYSIEQVEELSGIYDTGHTEEKQTPHIIMIMNEAWSDLQVMGKIDMTAEEMPFLESLHENVARGNLHVSIWGGLTANTEYEALTGDALALLSPTVIPYSNQVKQDIYALPRVLKSQGYYTLAMHPSGAAAWNRGKVYPYFGFDNCVFIDDFQTEYMHLRDFVSDECNFNEIIYQYEHRPKDSPFFLFDVTIQNHSAYYGGIDLPISINSVNGIPAEDAGYVYDAETYINLMKITDDSFARLVSYFEQVDEPVVICMFGDHQPRLHDDFYQAMFQGRNLTDLERNMLTFVTPYVIWANYDIDLGAYGDFSANYLPAVLLDSVGVESPPYYQFLLELKKEWPVLSVAGCTDADGRHCLTDSIMNERKIQEYQILQYNHLYAKPAYQPVFIPGAEKETH